MLGGMSGGGMGFIFDPNIKEAAQERMQEIMARTKRRLETALPFAMEPVVYDFAINEHGTRAELLQDYENGNTPPPLMPPGYYAMMVPQLLHVDRRGLPARRRAELDRFGAACRSRPELAGMVQTLFDRLFPRAATDAESGRSLVTLLAEYGFDHVQHEQIRADLKAGRIGLAQNRLPVNSDIRDVQSGEVADLTGLTPGSRPLGRDNQSLPEHRQLRELGMEALASGAAAVISLAGGVGSRWTQGAGVVKALHPFCKLGGRHRTFIEVHLAKSRRIGLRCGRPVPHVITTSYLTHAPIEAYLAAEDYYGYERSLLHLSPGRAVGLRLIPMARDLRFAWEEMPQQLLDEQAQKVRESLHSALIGWAHQAGEGSDYTDNVPPQCLHPVGHWFEIPNLFKNGVLLRLLEEHPNLQYLMVHNIDALGTDVDPAVLGWVISQGAAFTAEVITRCLEDRGGGLACVENRCRTSSPPAT
jgi:hypothetical protein